MPELPEVEMFARYFARHALDQRIVRVRVLDERILGTRDIDRLVGRTFARVRRHGKHLFACSAVPGRVVPASVIPSRARVIPSEAKDPRRTRRGSLAVFAARDDTQDAARDDTRDARDDIWLHMHFGMSGDLAYGVDALPRFARLIFDFDNGAHLAYEDMRLFGVVDLTPSPDAYIREYQLGPDPLDAGFNLRAFRALLRDRRGRVKALLLSQDVIAGIGNLYADEALYRSSIDPRRAADRLRDDEVKLLFRNIRAVLRETIAFKARGRSYPPRFLIQHREEGERCPRCGGTIRRATVAGRTTYWCAKHQA